MVKNLFSFFRNKVSGSVWQQAKQSLDSYNKTIITLSSSLLVLSFSLLKVIDITLNVFYLKIAWISFFLVISLGVLVLLFKFFYFLCVGIIKKKTFLNIRKLSDILGLENVFIIS